MTLKTNFSDEKHSAEELGELETGLSDMFEGLKKHVALQVRISISFSLSFSLSHSLSLTLSLSLPLSLSRSLSLSFSPLSLPLSCQSLKSFLEKENGIILFKIGMPYRKLSTSRMILTEIHIISFDFSCVACIFSK